MLYTVLCTEYYIWYTVLCAPVLKYIYGSNHEYLLSGLLTDIKFKYQTIA